MELDNDILYLKGVGPQRAQLLGRELSIFTYDDLLHFFPFRYVDRSVVSPIDQLDGSAQFVVFKGIIRSMRTTATSKHSERLNATLFDGTGTIDLVWFQGTKWVKEKRKPNIEYLVYGNVSWFNGEPQMAHPDIEPFSYDEERHNYLPVYNTTEKLKAAGDRKSVV